MAPGRYPIDMRVSRSFECSNETIGRLPIGIGQGLAWATSHRDKSMI
jgi:hypothetical protein